MSTLTRVNKDVGVMIVLRDLQSLLVKTIGSDVEVVNYETSMLLPKGENYGSTMLKVEALIKRTKNSTQEKMHFVAKMMPTIQLLTKNTSISASFVKEIYVCEKLSQYYRDLEREAGVKEEDLIDVFPKFYGGRLTRNKESINEADEADEDTVMLLENLKVRGYDTMDRINGLDLDHAKLAITELARFHALGMALKYNKPALFEEARKPMNVFVFMPKKEDFQDVTDHTLDLICSDSRIRKYEDRVRKSILTSNGIEYFTTVEEVEPWVTIYHGDFWVNNMLFHHAENGEIDDVKFVDYQLSRLGSPLKDLTCFICTSGNAEVMDKHFDELLDAYYKRFVEVLGYCGCDVSPFSKMNFEEQLDKNARSELFHCVVALKFVTMEVDKDMDVNDIKSSVMLAGGSKVYLDRSWKIVSKFVEKGWI